jgi:eukaryotic-like serine/threonine-protein kinase
MLTANALPPQSVTAATKLTASVTRTDPAYELSPRGRTLLQERLTTYAFWVGLIAIAYWPAFYLIWGSTSNISRQAVVAHILSPDTCLLLLTHAGLWITCRARAWPAAWQPRIDVAAHVALGLAFGRIMRHHPSPELSVLEGLLALTSILSVRALLVPSSGARTALVGVLTCLGPGLALATAPAHFSGAALTSRTLSPLFVNWAVIAVVLSTIASVVLYGLRRDVRDARRLGQYTLIEKIGRGGMGVVYRARHALLRRPTAIKLLPSAERHGSLERFEREVQLMAELTHPNTVAVHDYGRTADGIFYYAMEYLDGVDLDGLVAVGGPQPAARVLHILQQICGSLDEAHRRGLIHRDIKPANVFLCRGRSEPDTIKVLDFGLVKDLQSPRDPALSGDHHLVGTPLYIAPESIAGSAPVDARSDLYSLGAVAYFLLTGTPLFSATTVVEICMHHVYTRPQPLAERLGRPVAADLEAIVMSCLAKDPQQRPASARELARRLAACADAAAWSREAAEQWWSCLGGRVDARRRRRSADVSSPLPATGSLVVDPTRTTVSA